MERREENREVKREREVGREREDESGGEREREHVIERNRWFVFKDRPALRPHRSSSLVSATSQNGDLSMTPI